MSYCIDSMLILRREDIGWLWSNPLGPLNLGLEGRGIRTCEGAGIAWLSWRPARLVVRDVGRVEWGKSDFWLTEDMGTSVLQPQGTKFGQQEIESRFYSPAQPADDNWYLNFFPRDTQSHGAGYDSELINNVVAAVRFMIVTVWQQRPSTASKDLVYFCLSHLPWTWSHAQTIMVGGEGPHGVGLRLPCWQLDNFWKQSQPINLQLPEGIQTRVEPSSLFCLQFESLCSGWFALFSWYIVWLSEWIPQF